jgi:hypothetical protein
MTQGGFLAEMLASRRAKGSDTTYLWHYLYYIYVGLPLLSMYWVLFALALSYVTKMLYDLTGLGRLDPYSTLHLFLTVALSVGVSVALFHFKLIPTLLVPVKLITSV